MPLHLTPTTELAELAASCDVSKTIALYALTVAFSATGGAPPEVFEGMKQHLLATFRNATVNLPEAEAVKYRSYAEATIEELFSRLNVNGTPMRPLQS